MGGMGAWHDEYGLRVSVRKPFEFEVDLRLEPEADCDCGVDTAGVEFGGWDILYGDT